MMPANEHKNGVPLAPADAALTPLRHIRELKAKRTSKDGELTYQLNIRITRTHDEDLDVIMNHLTELNLAKSDRARAVRFAISCTAKMIRDIRRNGVAN
jgi:hypothetical protein